MKLEIGKFMVKDIVFGDKTAYANGVLTVDKDDALACVREDKHITDADLRIVHPGDMVRLCPVKDSVEFRCKVSGGEGAYPGVTSPLGQAGMGRTHVLDGVSLLSVGKHWGGFQDGLLDMGGPYQHYTIWGDMPNLVLVADTDELDEQREQQKRNHAIRWASLRLAEHIAECVRDMEPEAIDVYDLPPLAAKRSRSSPASSTCSSRRRRWKPSATTRSSTDGTATECSRRSCTPGLVVAGKEKQTFVVAIFRKSGGRK